MFNYAIFGLNDFLKLSGIDHEKQELLKQQANEAFYKIFDDLRKINDFNLSVANEAKEFFTKEKNIVKCSKFVLNKQQEMTTFFSDLVLNKVEEIIKC